MGFGINRVVLFASKKVSSLRLTTLPFFILISYWWSWLEAIFHVKKVRSLACLSAALSHTGTSQRSVGRISTLAVGWSVAWPYVPERGLSKDQVCPPAWVESTFLVLRCSKQKSVPVTDPEGLDPRRRESSGEYEVAPLTPLTPQQAHCIRTAAAFTSCFFVFLIPWVFLFVFALHWSGRYFYTFQKGV